MPSLQEIIQTLSRPLDQLPDPLPILPLTGPAAVRSRGAAPINITVRPPGSKSLTNRALLLAGLADGTSTLNHPLTTADDAKRMIAALRQLGAQVDDTNPESIKVTGVAGQWKPAEPNPTLFLNNAGTATRFLAAAALLAPGPITIDGNERMRQRPIGELADILTDLGADITYNQSEGCPPLTITPPEHLNTAEPIKIGRTQSSQFISALMLTAPCFDTGLTLQLGHDVTSASYIRMTIALLDQVSVTVKTAEELSTLRILPGLKAFDLDIEPDASGATYFWAAGALLPGAAVGVSGLHADSDQGDAAFPQVLRRMGATVLERAEHDDARTESHGGPRRIAIHGPDHLDPILVDMADMPDAAVTLAVVCAFAKGSSIIRGVRTLRVKETDRIQALKNELAKVDVTVDADAAGDPDCMTITPPDRGIDCTPSAEPVHFDTYDDHRMAMALSLIGLRRPNVFIKDPACVAKTYTNYYQHLAKLFN